MRTRREPVYRLANLLGKSALRGLGLRIRLSGVEHIPTSGPAVLAATHVSYLDFVLVELAAAQQDRFTRFMCRHDVWTRRPIGWAMDRMGHIPVDRETAAYAFLRARHLLEAGEVVGTFPEAGISHSFQVRPLMRGAVSLGLATGAPVLPIAIWGPQRVASIGRVDLHRGAPVDIHVGPPLDLRGLGRPGSHPDPRVEGTQRLGARLQAQLDLLQADPRHRPALGAPAPWHPAHLGGHAPDLPTALAENPQPRSAVTPTWLPRPGLEAS